MWRLRAITGQAVLDNTRDVWATWERIIKGPTDPAFGSDLRAVSDEIRQAVRRRRIDEARLELKSAEFYSDLKDAAFTCVIWTALLFAALGRSVWAVSPCVLLCLPIVTRTRLSKALVAWRLQLVRERKSAEVAEQQRQREARTAAHQVKIARCGNSPGHCWMLAGDERWKYSAKGPVAEYLPAPTYSV